MLLWAVFVGLQLGKEQYGRCSWHFGVFFFAQVVVALAASALFYWQVRRLHPRMVLLAIVNSSSLLQRIRVALPSRRLCGKHSSSHTNQSLRSLKHHLPPGRAAQTVQEHSAAAAPKWPAAWWLRSLAASRQVSR